MNTKKCKWTENEEQVLRDLVNVFGTKEWTKIAGIMNKVYKTSNKTGKQCRERWTDHLCDNITKARWSPQEESLLITHYSQLNSRWNHISELFPGRSINSVKNRFFSLVRKSLRKMCHFISSTGKQLNVYCIKANTFTHIFQDSIPADVLKVPQYLHEGWTIQNRLMQYLKAFMPSNGSFQKTQFSASEILEAINDIVSLNQAYEEGKLSVKKTEQKEQTRRSHSCQQKSVINDESLASIIEDKQLRSSEFQTNQLVQQKNSQQPVEQEKFINDFCTFDWDLDRYIFPSNDSEPNATMKQYRTPPYDVNQGFFYFF